jgi:hypothetical protein
MSWTFGFLTTLVIAVAAMEPYTLTASGRNLRSSHQGYESAKKDLLYARQKMREFNEKESSVELAPDCHYWFVY